MQEGASRALRVVLVSHYFPAHLGGVELVAGRLAERLVRPGALEIEWRASDCDAPPPPVPGLRCLPQPAWNGIERMLGIPYPLWSPAALWRTARAARAADVVHLHDFLYLPCLAAFIGARLAGRPVLATQHIGAIPYRSALLRALLGLANRSLGALVLGRAGRVVFVSETVRAYFSRFTRWRAPPLLVANGVDAALFAPAERAQRERLRAELGVAPGEPLLAFVGRFVEKKGLPVLRAIAARLTRARWLVAGWGPLDPAGWGMRNVTVKHRASPAELARLYQAADLLVLPSVGEGFPLTVQEAMSCGTPALVGEDTAAGCPGAGEVLLAEPVGAADTAERWAARIESLLGSPRLEELRPRVAAFARENWSWTRCAERYAAELRSLASAARTR